MRSMRGWQTVVSLAVVVLIATGCSAMNETDVAGRLAESAGLDDAIVEVQHPNAPWVNKYVIWMFVDDETPEGVAGDVRGVARFAVDDADLSGKDLTVFAVPGDERGSGIEYRSASLYIMGSVAESLGVGSGVEDVLQLRAADVRALANE